jgi:ABC-type amino acid transport system permease subunit
MATEKSAPESEESQQLSTLAILREGIRSNARSIMLVVGLLAGVLVLFVALGLLHVYNLDFVIKNLPSGLGPAATSMVFTNASFVLGLLAAIPLGLIRAYGPGLLRRRKATAASLLPYARAKELYGTGKAIRVVFVQNLRRALVAPAYGFATGFVEAMRGTPFLVQMFIVLSVMLAAAPRLEFLGWTVFYWSGLIALTINTAGYQAEVFRAGFQSVGQGQIEAAKAIGLKGRQVFSRITLPQSTRLIILPLTNEWISLFKASTILSYITIVELFFWARNFALDGQGVEAFIMLSIFFLAINVPLGRAISYIEQRRRIPGLGTQITEEKKFRRRTVYG